MSPGFTLEANEAVIESGNTKAPAVPPMRRFRDFMNSRAGGITLLVGLIVVILVAAQVTGVTSNRLLSLLVRGVMLAGIISLGAIGLTLISGVMKMSHFAQGDLMSAGAYIALVVVMLLPQGAPLAPFSFGYEVLIGLVIAMVLTGVIAVIFDRTIYRHLRARRAGPVVLAMASLGAALLLRSIIYLGWGADFSFFYTGRPRPAIELFSGINVLPDQLFILGLADRRRPGRSKWRHVRPVRPAAAGDGLVPAAAAVRRRHPRHHRQPVRRAGGSPGDRHRLAGVLRFPRSRLRARGGVRPHDPRAAVPSPGTVRKGRWLKWMPT